MQRKLVWGFVVILAIAHFDFWAWDDRTLIAGFMPSGLAYQALISALAASAWFLVVKFAWPTRIEAWAAEPVEPTDRQGGDA